MFGNGYVVRGAWLLFMVYGLWLMVEIVGFIGDGLWLMVDGLWLMVYGLWFVVEIDG